MALTDNILAYWKMDEASGSRADATGNGNTLTDNNTVGSAAGIIDLGASFVPSNSEYFSAGDALGDAIGTGDFTIAFWFKTPQLNTTRTMPIFDNFSGTGAAFQIRAGDNDDGNDIRADIDDGGAGSAVIVLGNDGSFQDDDWHFCVFTRSGTTAVMRLDDSVQDSVTSAQVDHDLTGINFNIGVFISFSANYMNGEIDEMGIWSRVLTSGEITELYNGGAGLSYPFGAGGNSNFFAVM